MNQKLHSIRRTFVISIVALATGSVLALGGVLYATSAIGLRQSVSPAQLNDLTRGYPEVAAYIQTQKAAEPHFTKLATLVKTDQQRLIARALLMAGLPILAVSGLVGYFLARRLLRPVERTFASQEQFLQDASHEMRNPLAALSAVIQEASSTNDPATQQQALARLSRQTHQLIKLNESLLTLERAKIPQANVALVNASELVLDTADSLNPEASSRSIRLALNVAPDVHVAMTNHDFVCIVRNLIHNAIKYSPDTSDVAINLRLDKQQAVLSIEDHGIGIPAHELARVGERFYRGTNVGRTRGTGLGLAIVQQIAQANRVGFKVSSREHLGTRVTLVFTNKGSTQR